MKGWTIAVTDTATELKVDSRHLLMVNDGSKTIYLQAEQGTDYPEQVSADNAKFFTLDPGESLLMDSDLEFRAFSAICSTGEVSALRWSAW